MRITKSNRPAVSAASCMLCAVGLLVALTCSAAPGDAPAPRARHTAVWTGSQMLVWGGFAGTGNFFNDGGIYDPAANTWSAIPTNGAPGPRYVHSAVWTGSEMIVWGGTTNGSPLSLFNTGGRFNLSTGTWLPTTTSGAPIGRDGHTAAWTGSYMVVWGGQTNGGYSGDGARYDPSTDSWVFMSRCNGFQRAFHTMIWTGTSVVMWGGYNLNGYLNYGLQYNPVANTWGNFTTTFNTPSARQDHTAVWTGTEMLVWGGASGSTRYGDGGRYNPASDTWGAKLSTTGAPSPRSLHTAVWTGTEMLIWGGRGATTGSYTNDGARYNPQTDTWTAMSSVGAPSARDLHTAIWTGTEMIVWGGLGPSGYLNDGGRYNPATDTWTPLPVSTVVKLTIQSTPTNTVVVSWPSSASTRVLQTNADLSTGAWGDVPQAPSDDGTNRSIVDHTGSRMFYRLR